MACHHLSVKQLSERANCQWPFVTNSIQNSKTNIFFQGRLFQIVVCRMSSILCRPQCVQPSLYTLHPCCTTPSTGSHICPYKSGIPGRFPFVHLPSPITLPAELFCKKDTRTHLTFPWVKTAKIMPIFPRIIKQLPLSRISYQSCYWPHKELGHQHLWYNPGLPRIKWKVSKATSTIWKRQI